MSDLTDRERRILGGISDGLSHRAIAERLHVSEDTIKKDLSRLMLRWGVRTRTQAVALALRQGWMR